ncbi:MliC family protein [Pseudanabaena sp. PCC 6802]|uniref:MliC family protein n=1 Tax=Pseudanabaena sp. PCC 6802 TaxID=118173 RepID=UPI000348F3AB|nr:MliC family protein [Pseudanabaena sp. PCC 6802]
MKSNSIRNSIIAATIALGSLSAGIAVANTATQTKPATTPKVAETKPAPTAKPAASTVKTVEYTCADKKTLKVEYSDKGAKFEWDKKQLTLASAKAGSGTKYSDGKTTLYTKDKLTSLEANGKKVLDRCVAK